MTLIALLSGAGRFFPPKLQRISGEGGKKQIPLYPATCVLSFRVECCCLLALQERERVKKILWRCVSFVCALFFSDVRPIYEKEEKKSLKKRENWWKWKSSLCK